MIVKIKNKLWTHFSWWDQLLINKNQILVRNLDSNSKITAFLIIAENDNDEELKKLLEYLHGAAVSDEKSFNVENWITRIKKRKKS